MDDLDWAGFVHGLEERCRRQLWLDEVGTTGDLAALVVRCECGRRRPLYEAAELDQNPLGTCRGARPWLGINTNEGCNHPSRLLIRTASNAYFPQIVSALSLPDRGSAIEGVVRDLWDDLQIVDDAADLAFIRKKPKVAEALALFQPDEILETIGAIRRGNGGERPVKQVELEALLRTPEGFGDDVPIDPDFHARRLPDAAWRQTDRSAGIASVVQLHRLREVLALIGFTRLEAVMPDIHGEYETDVERADIALEPRWFPAVENRGEGVFVQIGADAIAQWLQRPAVQQRLEDLRQGHQAWTLSRKTQRPFPGGPYVLLHTLSHLLIRLLAMPMRLPGELHSGAGLRGGRGGRRALRDSPLHGHPRCRGDARRPGAAGPTHRRPSRGCATDGSAVLQRPDLRAARAGHKHGRAPRECSTPRPWSRTTRRSS